MRRRVLLIGATGSFGSRLAVMLSRFPDVELVLAGRRTGPLEALAGRLSRPGAPVASMALDRGNLAGLDGLAPWAVIDAAGPFQGSDYAVARAALACGAHYLDIADARDFVAGFVAAVDGEARAAGRLAVAGASSTPALSHAAVRALVEGWQEIQSIDVAICPGARAPRGRSVVEAILSYVGRPVRVFTGARWTLVPGWSGLRRIDVPPLGHRLASICETPDLDLLADRFPVRQHAVFRAGLELAVLHLGLAALSLPVRLGLLWSLRPLAGPLRQAADWIAPLGTDRGAMVVEADGRDAAGRPARARWILWSGENAGPSVPVAPAAALLRLLLTPGTGPAPGARLACDGLTVGQIMAELEGEPIWTRIDRASPGDPALFRRLLGADFERLDGPVRALHDGTVRTASGTARVRIGPRRLSRLVAWALRLPPPGQHPVVVTMTPEGSGERWDRRFTASRFRSVLRDGHRMGVFEERVGPVSLSFSARDEDGSLVWHSAGWRILGLPMPRVLAPRVRARATGRDGRYRFRVVVALAGVGLLFGYRGTLDDGGSASR